MDLNKLISFIPDGILSELAVQTNVDHYTKKLHGEVIFKLLLHCLISHKNNSLRTMESAYESMVFRLLNNHNKDSVRFNSISERLSVINPEFFEKIYLSCVNTYKESIESKGSNIIRFDSTIVTLSSALINIGYQTGGDSLCVKQLKFTVGYSEIPEIVNFYHENSYSSENKALKETILNHKVQKSKIRVFDRGITSRNTYDDFAIQKINYVSRISNIPKYKVSVQNCLAKSINTASLKINKDSWVYLYGAGKKKAKYAVRLIEAIVLESNEQITFVTNIAKLSAAQITELYRRRWDIEVFFKFLKQELNFKHLINRSENGIKVMLYVTMIAAILLLEYKKRNGFKGFKIVKQKFAQELEFEITKHIITLCGGDSSKLNKVLGIPPT